MTRVTELMPLLKRLQLGPMAATLPECIALARRDQLDYASFLEIILADEIGRREHRRIELPAPQCWLRAGLPPRGLRLDCVGHRGPPPGWTPSSLWSSWTSTNMSCSSAPPALARASSHRPWVTPPSAPDTPSASSMPTTSSRP